MRRLLFLAFLFVLTTGFTLSWSPVTMYTDNTVIEPAFQPVMYDAWVDGTPLVVGTTATSVSLIDNTYGATHTYTVRTRLLDGRVSADEVATLTSPLDLRVPGSPTGLTISE